MGQEGRMAAVANTSVTPKEPTAAVTAVLEQYGKIQMALANNKLDGVADSARAIKKIIADDVKRTLPAEISEPTENLTSAKDLGAARTAFELLSASLGEFLAKQKIQTGRYFQIYCPMAEASWLQTDKTVRNPYYGKSMPGCGKVVATY